LRDGVRAGVHDQLLLRLKRGCTLMHFVICVRWSTESEK
jgi:hypothetical protein